MFLQKNDNHVHVQAIGVALPLGIYNPQPKKGVHLLLHIPGHLGWLNDRLRPKIKRIANARNKACMKQTPPVLHAVK